MPVTGSKYQLGVDLGSACSVTALCRGSSPPEVVPVDGPSGAITSALFLGADGAVIAGQNALRYGAGEPGDLLTRFKHRVGGELVTTGRLPITAEMAAARLVEWSVAQVADREGEVANGIGLAHPAHWGDYQLEALAGALGEVGLDRVELVTEPYAAVLGYGGHHDVQVGASLGVCDFGAGSLSAATVRRRADGSFEPAGTQVVAAGVGGTDLDDYVLAHVTGAIGDQWSQLDMTDPAVVSGLDGLRTECTRAKEALSFRSETLIPVVLPGVRTHVRLTRAEFETMIRPVLASAVEEIGAALSRSGVDANALSTMLLVGGSGRIPLVVELIGAEFGCPVFVEPYPKGLVASGAAVFARDRHGGGAAPWTPSAGGLAAGAKEIGNRWALGAVAGTRPLRGSRRNRRLVVAAAATVITAVVGTAVAAAAAASQGSGSDGQTLASEDGSLFDPIRPNVSGFSYSDPWAGGALPPGALPPAAAVGGVQPVASATAANSSAVGSGSGNVAPTSSGGTGKTKDETTSPTTTPNVSKNNNIGNTGNNTANNGSGQSNQNGNGGTPQPSPPGEPGTTEGSGGPNPEDVCKRLKKRGFAPIFKDGVCSLVPEQAQQPPPPQNQGGGNGPVVKAGGKKAETAQVKPDTSKESSGGSSGADSKTADSKAGDSKTADSKTAAPEKN